MMMYLQIIYQHQALQIPKMIREKAFQLACKVVRYGFTKNHYIFSMEYKICTEKLHAAATVHSQEQSDLYMLVTTVKGLTCR